MTPGAPSPSWSIVSQTQRTMPGPGGGLQDGVLIYFQTGAGHSGQVFVPMATYALGPDAVKPLVARAAANMDAVGSITG